MFQGEVAVRGTSTVDKSWAFSNLEAGAEKNYAAPYVPKFRRKMAVVSPWNLGAYRFL